MFCRFVYWVFIVKGFEKRSVFANLFQGFRSHTLSLSFYYANFPTFNWRRYVQCPCAAGNLKPPPFSMRIFFFSPPAGIDNLRCECIEFSFVSRLSRSALNNYRDARHKEEFVDSLHFSLIIAVDVLLATLTFKSHDCAVSMLALVRMEIIWATPVNVLFYYIYMLFASFLNRFSYMNNRDGSFNI